MQDYNKLEATRTFYKFSWTFSLLHECKTSTKKFLVHSVKSITHKKCLKCFLYFSSYFQTCYLIVQYFQQVPWLPSEVTCLQSPGREWNISQLCLIWNYHRYSFLCFRACIQLVKVSNVFVFLRRGLLMQDTEYQEDQNLFEICLVEHSVQICHQIVIFLWFQLSEPLYSLSQLECIKPVWKRPSSTKYRAPRCPKQLNLQNLPQVQWRKVQEESSTHEESSSSE